MEHCQICTDTYTSKLRRKFECTAGCGQSCCIQCFKAYQLTQISPRCMNPECAKDYTTELIARVTNATFFNHEYRHAMAVNAMSRERSLLPESSIELGRVTRLKELTYLYLKLPRDIALMRNKIRYINEYEALQVKTLGVEFVDELPMGEGGADSVTIHGEKLGLLQSMHTLHVHTKQKVEAMTQAISETLVQYSAVDEERKAMGGRDRAVTKRTYFCRPCAHDGCNSFVSARTHWKCPVCRNRTCKDCFCAVDEDDIIHECDPDMAQTATMLRDETKPCPSCHVAIFKIDGCDQMYCTACHTSFSWRTGRKLTGRNHNPHYIELLRGEGAGWTAARDPGECDNAVENLHPDMFTQRCKQLDLFCGTYRHMTELTDVHVPRYMNARERRDERLRHLRFEYIRGELDDEAWLSQIKRCEKRWEFENEVSDIMRMYISVCSENLIRYVRDEAFTREEFVAIIPALQTHATSSMKKTCSMYNMRTPVTFN